jgi:hypothetical protein
MLTNSEMSWLFRHSEAAGWLTTEALERSRIDLYCSIVPRSSAIFSCAAAIHAMEGKYDY